MPKFNRIYKTADGNQFAGKNNPFAKNFPFEFGVVEARVCERIKDDSVIVDVIFNEATLTATATLPNGEPIFFEAELCTPYAQYFTQRLIN